MERYLNMRFADEFGKNYTLRVEEPRENLSSEEVKTAAAAVIDSGAFRASAKLTAANKAEIVKVERQTLFEVGEK